MGKSTFCEAAYTSSTDQKNDVCDPNFGTINFYPNLLLWIEFRQNIEKFMSSYYKKYSFFDYREED